MRYHEMGHSDFWTSFARILGKMTSEWSDAKIDYDAAGGERILAVHQFRSRVHHW